MAPPLCSPLRRLLLLLLLLPLFTSLPPALSAPRCHAADKRSALQLKKALGDPYTLTTWTAATDCCSDWYGTECDPKTGRVTTIVVSSSGAAGPLPPVVGDFPYLNKLIIHQNPNVTGPIPPQISKLTNLEMLWMDWNSLTGPVPAFLGHLAKLDYINLSFNKLSGSIPPTLGDLPLLGGLFLDRNSLTGTIPESLGRLRRAEGLYIRLGHNQLTGPIPQSLGNLNIAVIDLSRNRLTGDPSVLFRTGEWISPRSTISIDLSRNEFEFDLSTSSFSLNIGLLDLNHNRIYGKIPAQLTKLPALQLNVSYNRLCGEIPPGGLLQGLTMYEFFHNKCLCGKPLGPPCK